MVEEEDLSVKTMRKRYEGLLLVRSKAVKGKGAWYWTHLEPTLVHNPETGVPKAVKLKCGLCNAMFSASNPSRTASEHLKRGTCPNFSSALAVRPPPPPLPLASASPPGGGAGGGGSVGVAAAAPHTPKPPRKRSASAASSSAAAVAAAAAAAASSQLQLALPSSSADEQQRPLLLSGGKEDLGALAALEDNVKRIKSPGLGQGLSREQSEAALCQLADWLYESYGRVPLGCFEQPKFRLFLHQLGLQGVSRQLMLGPRLDARYEEARQQSESRLGEALFFQLSFDGWKRRRRGGSVAGGSGEELVYVTLNLPNGSSLFCRAVPPGSSAFSSKAVESILEETMESVCRGSPERCVGIVADAHKFANKALQEMEARRPWMVNVTCQAQAFVSVLGDFSKRSPVFRSIASVCLKIVTFFRTNAHARALLQRYQQEYTGRVRELGGAAGGWPLGVVLPVDVSQSARALQSTVLDSSFKMYAQDPEGREVMEVVATQGFWADVDAVHSLVRIVRSMVRDMERERPLVSQCIPLWNELRGKVMTWCATRLGGRDKAAFEAIIQERFARYYHPAWAAALLLDPLYLVKDATGNRYLPYKSLSPDQEKDVDRLITRLVSREEAHLVLRELMKWRAEGLDPLYAQAVQVREADPISGRLRCVSAQGRRLVWEKYLDDFKYLGKVAARLIFLHATSCGLKSWAMSMPIPGAATAQLGPDRAAKMRYIAAHARLERGMNPEDWDDGLDPDDEEEESKNHLQQQQQQQHQQQQQQQQQQHQQQQQQEGMSHHHHEAFL